MNKEAWLLENESGVLSVSPQLKYELHTTRTPLFYYFIEKEGDPIDDPILLWYSGGHGCSAFKGLIYENGTFSIPDAKLKNMFERVRGGRYVHDGTTRPTPFVLPKKSAGKYH